jgi:hypothetical protein
MLGLYGNENSGVSWFEDCPSTRAAPQKSDSEKIKHLTLLW